MVLTENADLEKVLVDLGAVKENDVRLKKKDDQSEDERQNSHAKDDDDDSDWD